MRLGRSNGLALLLTTLVATSVCVGEVPHPVREAAVDSTVHAYREQRLEWMDDQAGEVVVAAPPWHEAIQEQAPTDSPGFPGGDSVASAVLATGIPETAMAAYTDAADNLAQADPGCGLRWSVIAAIGRIESNHGRYGGARLHTDGSTRPVIRGIALDGRPGVAVIGDSDGGGLDGDRAYDRAVGPMQFIPSTWRDWASDGNNDGVRDPDNMFDAALAAGRYLCAGGVDTRTPEGLSSAIFRYNHSMAYVSAVIAIAEAYVDNRAPVVPDPANTARAEVASSAEVPVVVTTTPPAPVETAPPSSVEATPSGPVEVTPSTPVPTTEPTPSSRPAEPDPHGICTVLPNPSSAPPWVPLVPVLTCPPWPLTAESEHVLPAPIPPRGR